MTAYLPRFTNLSYFQEINMIKSMTAFARQPIEQDWGNGAWEIRSVNSRFLETNFRLPEAFRYLEFKLREKLRKKLNRGKLDCSLRLDMNQADGDSLSVDVDLVSSLLKSHQSMEKIANIAQEPDLTRLLIWPGLIKKTEVDTMAVSIGNMHGVTKFRGGGVPDLDLERLKKIHGRVPGIPIVLHGASGIGGDQIGQAIKFGVRVVNIDTELRLAFSGVLRKTLEKDSKMYDPRKILGPTIEAIEKVVSGKIEMFGSGGKY